MSRPGSIDAAVLLSGSGRTLENFLERIAAGTLPIRIVAVVSSRSDVKGVAIAREASLPVAVFRRKDYATPDLQNAAINAWLAPHDPRLILLAGYLCFYSPPAGFAGHILNIHPALLPKYGGRGFYGDRVHRAVLEAGDAFSGCTVHEVSAVYDEGRILGQAKVPVLPGDTVEDLAGRVFSAECDLYPEVIRRVVAGEP